MAFVGRDRGHDGKPLLLGSIATTDLSTLLVKELSGFRAAVPFWESTSEVFALKPTNEPGHFSGNIRRWRRLKMNPRDMECTGSDLHGLRIRAVLSYLPEIPPTFQ